MGIALFEPHVWLPLSGDYGGIGAPLRIALRQVAATFIIGVALMAVRGGARRRFTADGNGERRRAHRGDLGRATPPLS